MTPAVLLDTLKEFTERETRDLLLPVKGEGDKSAAVHKMRLPDQSDVKKKAPYIILQVLNGSDEQQLGKTPQSKCNVRIIACCYCEDASLGAMYILNLLTRLRLALLKKRVIGEMFTLELPLEYIIYPDDTAPYFMGEMATTWQMPIIEREVDFT